MKILNLYAWIGGNRKLRWDEHEITAVEYNENIASVYKDLYPNDTLIIWDAHEYLLKHYKEFDFIRASPPCPSHSDIRRCWVHAGQYEALYPDMSLYQEIILLKHFAPKDTKRCIENVKPYYDMLIPWQIFERHVFRTNFHIEPYREISEKVRIHNWITATSTIYGMNLDKYNVPDKRKMLRNMVDPQLAKHIFEESKKVETIKTLF